MPNRNVTVSTAVLASLALLSAAGTGIAADPAGSTHPTSPRPEAPAPSTLPPPSNGGPTGLVGVHLPPPPQPIDDFTVLDPNSGNDAQVDAAIGLIVLPAATDLGLTSADTGPLEASVAYCYPDTGVGCGIDGKLTTFEENCQGGLGSGENDSGPYVSCTVEPSE